MNKIRKHSYYRCCVYQTTNKNEIFTNVIYGWIILKYHYVALSHSWLKLGGQNVNSNLKYISFPYVLSKEIIMVNII